MVSQEFQAAVNQGNLLRARIMLKDSLLVDPTFLQFNELLAYGRTRLPDLIEPFDGELLNMEPSCWNQDQMNMELVQLVNNFSLERINHLKKVIEVVKADDIKKYELQKKSQRDCTHRSIADFGGKRQRQEAVQEIVHGARLVRGLLRQADKNGKWNPEDIEKMEQAARWILKNIKKYKEGR